jgi:16S rRNA (guanine1207-N2)-methyltransferase
VPAIIEIPDEDLLLHANLRSGEGNAAVTGVERVKHLIDETDQFAVDVGDLGRLRLEHRITKGADFVGHAWQATPAVSHYFDHQPHATSEPKSVAVDLPDISFRYDSDTGVFSHGHLDTGTSLLLRCDVRPRSDGTLLDLGCGAGPIALSLALRSPHAETWAVDVNERARDLTRRNARRNGLVITVAAPNEVPSHVTFDEIWSNPPIRVGKSAMDDIITTWLDRLTPDGRMVLVISRHLGADSLHRRLEERGHLVERVAARAGFRVLSVTSAQ